jgi:Uma2 family endonuclease
VLPAARNLREVTYADILALPENVVGEIIDGDLIVSPRPAVAHALASSNLGGELFSPFLKGRGGPGGWWIFDEPELHLGRHVLVPDLAGWRRERMPVPPSTAFFTLEPDWVCEVLSPASGRIDRVKKLRIYREQGVTWAWLVDPLQQTLEVFQSDGEKWTVAGIYGGNEVVRAVPFDAVKIELTSLWIPEVPVEGDAGKPAE